MADIKLADGRELVCDLSLVTIKEYRQIIKSELPQEEEDAMVARLFGLTADELNSLPYPDWRRVVACMYKTAREPLDDGDKKKSESELTSS